MSLPRNVAALLTPTTEPMDGTGGSADVTARRLA